MATDPLPPLPFWRPTTLMLMAIVLLALAGMGFWGYQLGGNSARRESLNRYDSLSTAYANCRTDLATVQAQATIAKGFLASYDHEIVKLQDEKQAIFYRYRDSLAVLRKYNSADAERAIAAYYLHHRQ